VDFQAFFRNRLPLLLRVYSVPAGLALAIAGVASTLGFSGDWSLYNASSVDLTRPSTIFTSLGRLSPIVVLPALAALWTHFRFAGQPFVFLTTKYTITLSLPAGAAPNDLKKVEATLRREQELVATQPGITAFPVTLAPDPVSGEVHALHASVERPDQTEIKHRPEYFRDGRGWQIIYRLPEGFPFTVWNALLPLKKRYKRAGARLVCGCEFKGSFYDQTDYFDVDVSDYHVGKVEIIASFKGLTPEKVRGLRITDHQVKEIQPSHKADGAYLLAQENVSKETIRLAWTFSQPSQPNRPQTTSTPS
jgi:hypothetical protein